MKTNQFPTKSYVSFLIFICCFLFNPIETFADPYFYLCPPYSYCDYFDAGGVQAMCGPISVDLYARGDFSLPEYSYTYQWQSSVLIGTWSNMSGKTARNITITNSIAIRCEVKEYISGSYNRTYYTDASYIRIATEAPSITPTGDPADASRCPGSSVTFSCAASGSYKTYQWYKIAGATTSEISGATNYNYTFTTAESHDNTQYFCRVSNGCGSDDTEPATLTVFHDFTNITNPVPDMTCEGVNANFSVSYNGDETSKTWQVWNGSDYITINDNSTYSGTKTNTLTVKTPPATLNNNWYNFHLVNSTCSWDEETNGAKLTVYTKLKNISVVPSGTIILCDGDKSNLILDYDGDSPISIQWQEYSTSWHNISGETGETLQITASINRNNYRYRALLTQSNDCNTSLYSPEVTVSVKSLPIVDSHPQPVPKCSGENANFSVTASGSNLTYQWQYTKLSNWTNLTNDSCFSNVTSPTLDITGIDQDIDQSYYRCKITGYCETIFSNSAKLTVNMPPEITVQPEDTVKCTGQSARFAVTATGTATLEYKWRKNGSSLTGDLFTLNNFLDIDPVTESDADNYDVIIRNTCNPTGITSDAATLTVNIPPTVNAHPIPVSLCEGTQSSISFSTDVIGGNSLLWQVSKDTGNTWIDLSNDTIYSGVTQDVMTISDPVAAMNAYQYRCQVIGSCDPPVTTNPALLTVKSSPVIMMHPVNDTVCAGASMAFNISASGTGPLEYKWKKGGQGITDWISSSSYVFDEVLLDDDEEPVFCLVRNECAFTTPVESDEAIIHVNPPPPVSLGKDIHLCPGDQATLDPETSFTSYLWSTDETTKTIKVSDQGNYKLTVTDDKGCSNEDKIYIWVDPAIPELDLGEDAAYCSGDDVTLDASDQYDTYDWNTEGAESSIDVTETGDYFVTVSKNNSVCIESDTVHVQVVEPYQDEEICLITVDMGTGNNIIVWEKTPDMNIVAYNIYRQTTVAGEYELLETKPYEDLSIYMDDEADPEVRQWVYKITAVDTCNNESDIKVSPYHRPLFLEYNGADDGVNLRWEPYVVEGAEMEFLTYEIYRGSDSSTLAILDEISGDLKVYKDKDPNALTYKYFYRVAGVKSNPCYPSADKKADSTPYSHSMSNIEDNRLQVVEGVNNLKSAGTINIYPNPFNETTTLQFTNPNHSEYRLAVRDLSGKVVYMSGIITGEEIVLNREGLTAGYYLVELIGESIYRGKVVVE